MIYDKVTIKQIPDDVASLTGLNKYNRSKMPSTGDFLQPAIEGGRAVTGIDEDSFQIQRIKDDFEREKVAKETKALRESLEKLTGKDLSATSPFWETFGVRLSSDSDLVLNRANPIDVIRYHVLVSNHYAIPDKNKAGLPEYRATKYYCFVEDKVNDEEVSTQMSRDKARSELLKLSEDENRMVIVGQYLEGDKYKAGMKQMTLYKMLSDYISSVLEPDNIKRFVKAVGLSNEELQFKIIVDRAIKKKIIRLNKGYYQRGQVTLGTNPLEVYENLKKPEFATEFLSLKEELE